MHALNQTILRNEPFGGVYFNQATGRTAMVDQEGFVTLLKYLKKGELSERESNFVKYFFNENTPKMTKLVINKAIKFEKGSQLITQGPVLIDLSLNNYCNLNCSYCYMSATESGENLSMDDFEILLARMVKSRVLQIALGGGEPTLHPNFTEILCKLRVEGDIIPNYTTNGTNLTAEILKASKEYCGAVAVSYSEQRENETLKAVKTLVDYGIQTNIHVVLLKSRISSLSKIVEKYAKLGIFSVVLLLFKPMGRGANLDREILTVKESRAFSVEVLKILALKKKYGVRLAIDACSAFTAKYFPFLPESVDGCTGGTYSAYIDWDLKMKPCSFMQDTTRGVDMKQNSIEDAWKSDLFESFRQNILNARYEGCITCDFFPSCKGGCPLKPELTYCIDKGKEIK